ncbi:MAG: UDP-3-O-acyl-N-acetylglucosamine deacetylase [Bacteroidales bacterium]|nr:UDP-3-O-acyl-N-acetylglucosamine deacetylase [Bacteroidales bacterium]
MNQRTLAKAFSFEGKGLHTGRYSHVSVLPAGADSGIVFRRTDLGGAEIAALAENVSSTARSTTLSSGEASVATVEHILSALTGMGIDNAEIEIDNIEMPILDGSASVYTDAIAKAGTAEQDAPRRYVSLSEPVEISNPETGSFVRLEPAEDTSYGITVDFGSKVLGIQEASFSSGDDYAAEIGPCRTFCFFHELEFLLGNNLIKGGDVDNAIVIVEHPVSREQLEKISTLFGKSGLEVVGEGYLNNLTLHFPNECGRHKLLDLIGDMRLTGGFLRARVTAFKPGHSINTQAALAVRKNMQ